MIRPHADAVALTPQIHAPGWMQQGHWKGDVRAGITVAIFAIPQAMAYAILAGLPPVHGLYTAVVTAPIAALWGSSRFVNTGPTNSSAILTATAIAPLAAHPDLLGIVALFTLMVGLLRMLFGMLRLGDLAQFVPEPVFIGFTTGVGFLIGLGQLHHLFGTVAPETTWFPARMAENLSRLVQADWRAVALGLGSFAAMWAARKHRRIPSGLLVIVCGTGLAWLFGWKDSLTTAGDIGPITGALPLPILPLFELPLIIALLPAAAAVAIIGLIEAVSIGQSLALKHQEHLNTNQEFFGQGLSQVIGAFFQCIPGSGSFSRTALIEQGGATTRFSHLIFSAATVLALLAIPGALAIIPVPCLAGLLLYVGMRLMDHHRIHRVLRTSREDAWVLGITCIITVLIKVEYGLFAGVLLGNVMFLRRTRSLHMPEVVPYPDGRLEERAYTPGSVHTPTSLVALTVYGDLFYGVARELREQLLEVVHIQKPRIIIVRIRRVFSIDYACWNALFEFAEWFKKHGGALYISGVRPDALELIQAAGAQDALPENQVFPKTERLMEAFHIAVAAAIINLPDGAPKPLHWEAYLDTRTRNNSTL